MLRLTDFEDEAIAEPLIGKFDLLAIDEFLAEEAIFVTDGVAMCLCFSNSSFIITIPAFFRKPPKGELFHFADFVQNHQEKRLW